MAFGNLGAADAQSPLLYSLSGSWGQVLGTQLSWTWGQSPWGPSTCKELDHFLTDLSDIRGRCLTGA